MNEIEAKKLEIESALFELWHFFPKPKKSYTIWYVPISEALENWHLSDREKRIADREKGDVGI